MLTTSIQINLGGNAIAVSAKLEGIVLKINQRQ
jgi:hypothetical protein